MLLEKCMNWRCTEACCRPVDANEPALACIPHDSIVILHGPRDWINPADDSWPAPATFLEPAPTASPCLSTCVMRAVALLHRFTIVWNIELPGEQGLCSVSAFFSPLVLFLQIFTQKKKNTMLNYRIILRHCTNQKNKILPPFWFGHWATPKETFNSLNSSNRRKNKQLLLWLSGVACEAAPSVLLALKEVFGLGVLFIYSTTRDQTQASFYPKPTTHQLSSEPSSP